MGHSDYVVFVRKNLKNGLLDFKVKLVHKWVGGNPPWFCRIWRKNWLDRISRGSKDFGESYGKNKFEAYKKALSDLGNYK